MRMSKEDWKHLEELANSKPYLHRGDELEFSDVTLAKAIMDLKDKLKGGVK